MIEKGLIRSAPVVIGGVGGSGTRAVSNIMTKLGFYMGVCREPTKDNLLFTILFWQIPDCCTSISNLDHDEINEAISIFDKAMHSSFKSKFSKASDLMELLLFKTFHWNALNTKQKLIHLVKGLRNVMYYTAFVPRLRYADYVGWGWKEPISHIYIECLSNYFKDMKYILVIRKGMDMAFSNNRAQFEIWGKFFNIHIPEEPELLPKAHLNYWIQANKRAISLGKKLLGNRFLILSFEKLCHSPKNEIEKLLSFLEIDYTEININELCDLIIVPNTIDRYKNHDLSMFTKEEINAVREIEYMIDNEW